VWLIAMQKQSILRHNHKNFLNIPNFEQFTEAGVIFIIFTEKDRAKKTQL